MTEAKTSAPRRRKATRAAARNALQQAASRIHYDPLTNSVFTLAYDYFLQLQSGDLEVAELEDLAREVHLHMAEERCERFRVQHFGEDGKGGPVSQARKQIKALAKGDWDDLRTAVETPRGGIVFTAHPTFALSRRLRAAMAAYASDPTPVTKRSLSLAVKREGPEWGSEISLKGEHAEVQAVLANARAALLDHAAQLFSEVRKGHPEKWRTLKPALPTLATWVGYDLDGRTDIHWSQSLAFRLAEKAEQLIFYRDELARIMGQAKDPRLNELHARLSKAEALTRAEAKAFSADLTQPDELVRAANVLTEKNADRITDVSEITKVLDAVLSDKATSDPVAVNLAALRAVAVALQLGTGRIHLRVNAAQIRTVIRRDLGLETEDRHLGRLAFRTLADKAGSSKPRKVNFADLLLEQSTARRQFMMCAQILKHIDAGSPIRFLIAEAENPATVMGALYLARQYGVDEMLDISPLFETPEALETGGRFMERLLDDPEYVKYLKARGYMSVQFGFSDAGRFIGQVAADMAIERLHNLIARALADRGLGLGVLFFNTHGESMGRGAYPGTFEQRFDHLLSPWNRANLARRGTVCQHEVSFQGGDGFLHFATPQLAEASLAAFVSHQLSPVPDVKADAFYTNNEFSWDLYRSMRSWQEALFNNPDYEHLLGDFAAGFNIKAGSRQKRRTGGPKGPRALRAISHNSILQQLGVPANTAAGLGSSTPRETDQLINMINNSPRLRALVMLALKARVSTSVPAFRAYAQVYTPGLWVAFARREKQELRSAALRRVAYTLDNYETPMSILRLSDILSVDLTKFDALLKELKDAPSAAERHEGRIDLHTLHAIRLAVMMHAFAVAGQLASISPRFETSARDILAMVTGLRLTEAVEALREIYPVERRDASPFGGLKEKGDTSSAPEERGYVAIHHDVIEPLEEASHLLHGVALAITHAYGAFG